MTSVVMGGNLATLVRLARFGPRDALYRAKASLDAADPFAPTLDSSSDVFDRIPIRTITELVPDKLPVTIDSRFLDVDGALPLYELLCLLMLVRAANPRAVIEIGTYFGSTTMNIALNLPHTIVHTVDLPEAYLIESNNGELPKDDFHLIESRRLGAAFAGSPEAARIVLHLGDSATLDFSSISESVTFFFIDGSHTYEYARSDTLRLMEVARQPSTFLWHDCDPAHPGVLTWLGKMVEVGFDVVRIAGTNTAFARIDVSDENTMRRIKSLMS